MKNAKKLLALLLALALCLGVFAGCNSNSASASQPASVPASAPADSSEPSEPERTENTLVASTEMGVEGKFSPFFALSASDMDVVDMFSVSALMLDRVNGIVDNAIEGETRSYNGTDYTYTGAGDVKVTENADGSVVYDITIRDDMKFSDGTPVDIDDLIFSYYVLLDPTYDGSSTLYSVPIKGLEDYRNATLFLQLVSAGRDNADFSKWDEATQTAFWADLTQAGTAFAQEIVDYLVANEANTAEDSVAACAANWGFALEEDATMEDFFWAMFDQYGGDIKTLSDTESAGSSIYDLMEDYDA